LTVFSLRFRRFASFLFDVTPSTIIRNILDKLRLLDRAQVAGYALCKRIVEPER